MIPIRSALDRWEGEESTHAPAASRKMPKYLAPEGAGEMLMINPMRQSSWQLLGEKRMISDCRC